jgi:hypothetical protein
MSVLLTIVLQSRFSPMTKILRAAGATFVYKMRATSRPQAKFTGDFGNAIEVIRISDRSLLSVFAKNLEPCNFRLLQHYPNSSRHAPERQLCASSGHPQIRGYGTWALVMNVNVRKWLSEEF